MTGTETVSIRTIFVDTINQLALRQIRSVLINHATQRAIRDDQHVCEQIESALDFEYRG